MYPRSNRSWLTVAAIILAVSMSSLPASAIDSTCQAMADSANKVILGPAHLYMTRTADFLRNGPEKGETIYVNNAIYVYVHGKWTHSRITAQEMAQDRKEAETGQKVTCRYVRDESVNGEAAALYTEHQVTDENETIDAQVWISKSRGLPLRSEIDMNVGGSMGKSHTSNRYEYNNVHPPAGVQ